MNKFLEEKQFEHMRQIFTNLVSYTHARWVVYDSVMVNDKLPQKSKEYWLWPAKICAVGNMASYILYQWKSNSYLRVCLTSSIQHI